MVPEAWKGDAAIGKVKIGVKIEDSFTDLGDFHYYKQVELESVTPRLGPAEGSGIIYLAGRYFTSDFPNSEVGCKVGDSIGKGIVIDEQLIQCSVESLQLVNEGDVLPVSVALNSYSWVLEQQPKRKLSD